MYSVYETTGNSSFGYQIMDRSKHTMTKYLVDEKTHKAIINQLFKRLNFKAKALYEVERVKTTIELPSKIIGWTVLVSSFENYATKT